MRKVVGSILSRDKRWLDSFHVLHLASTSDGLGGLVFSGCSNWDSGTNLKMEREYVQGVNKVRRHYSIAYNFSSYVDSSLKLYRLKELFSIKVHAMLQLLQPYFIAMIIHSSYPTCQTEPPFVIDSKHKGVAYQAVVYSYETVNRHLKTNINDRYCTKTIFYQYWIVDNMYILTDESLTWNTDEIWIFFIGGGGNKITSETKLAINS